MRALPVGRTDGECKRRVAGIIYRQTHPGRHLALERSLRPAVARVAGRDDNHDAGPHEAVDLDTQRAPATREPLGLECIADTHVDSMDSESTTMVIEKLMISRAAIRLLVSPSTFSR